MGWVVFCTRVRARWWRRQNVWSVVTLTVRWWRKTCDQWWLLQWDGDAKRVISGDTYNEMLTQNVWSVVTLTVRWWHKTCDQWWLLQWDGDTKRVISGDSYNEMVTQNVWSVMTLTMRWWHKTCDQWWLLQWDGNTKCVMDTRKVSQLVSSLVSVLRPVNHYGYIRVIHNVMPGRWYKTWWWPLKWDGDTKRVMVTSKVRWWHKTSDGDPIKWDGDTKSVVVTR